MSSRYSLMVFLRTPVFFLFFLRALILQGEVLRRALRAGIRRGCVFLSIFAAGRASLTDGERASLWFLRGIKTSQVSAPSAFSAIPSPHTFSWAPNKREGLFQAGVDLDFCGFLQRLKLKSGMLKMSLVLPDINREQFRLTQNCSEVRPSGLLLGKPIDS